MTFNVVRIPAALREWTDGNAVVNVRGDNVREALACLYGTFEGVAENVLDERGDLRGVIDVLVDGKDVRQLRGLDTKLRDGEIISLVATASRGAPV